MSLFVTLFAIYSIIMIGVGLSRRNGKEPTPKIVFFGERPLGSPSFALTVTASWFGAATFLITFQDAVRNGFSSLWTLGAPTVITLVLFIILTPKIRSLGHTSLSQFFNIHYGPAIASFVTALISIYMTLLAASQLSAWGLVAPLFDISPQNAIVTGTLCVVFYSAWGGFRSVIRTDRLQFILLSVAVLLLLLGAFLYSPGKTLSMGDFDFSNNLPLHLSSTLCFTLAWTISPIIWQRISASRSTRSARLGLSLSMILFSLLIAMLALAAIFWRPVLSSTQSPLFTIRQLTPVWMNLTIAIGIAAAIMSTADTALNTGALALQPFTEGRFERWSWLNLRGMGVILMGGVALWIALGHQSVLTLLGLAGELMSSALFIPGIYALLRGPGPRLAAGLSIFLGGVFAIISFIMQTSALKPASSWPVWPYSSLMGIGLSILGFAIGIIIKKRVD